MAQEDNTAQAGDAQEMVVGDFSIKRFTDHSIFIRKADGEGCEFPIKLFEIAVRMFYKENS